MPRSPLITQAVRKLSMYFGATTTSEYIAKSRLIAAEQASASSGAQTSAGQVSGFQRAIDAGNSDVSVGISFEDELAELIFGSRGIFYFNKNVSSLSTQKNLPVDLNRLGQVKIYGIEEDLTSPLPGVFVPGEIITRNLFSKNKQPNTRAFDPTKSLPNFYAVNVENPYLGPATRDVGALQIFLNGIPNIEFSKCVPYVDIDVITPRSSLTPDGTNVGEGITLLKFLNPKDTSEVDRGILQAQSTRVATESGAVTQGGKPLFGTKSSMELFTTPATLTNMDSSTRGREDVPVIDRFRPPMSLGQLQVSNKLRPAGGGLSFATARLEIVIHDRSRLRDFVDFVRPDLYGLTFMDITYGWSHIDGGIASNNAYGTLLDALKVKQRYRIINSSYTFDEVGQVKVSLSLATVGSTDLLFLRMRGNTSIYNQLERLARQLSSILQEYQRLPKTPSLSKIDTLTQFTDPNSILSAADDQGVLKQISEALSSNAVPASARAILATAYGKIEKKGEDNLYEVGQEGLVAKYKASTKQEYSKIVSGIPKMAVDPFGREMLIAGGRFEKMNAALGSSNYNPGALFTSSQSAAAGNLEEMGSALTVDAYSKVINDAKTQADFITLGAVFSNIVGAQLAKSQLYDEIQLIFYPFNRYAGAVNSLPVSCFPIEINLFNTAVATSAGKVQDLSLRDVIAIINDRFVSFPADRAYLMSNFYNSSKAQKGEAELEKLTISLTKGVVDGNIAKIDKKIAELNTRREAETDPAKQANIASSINELTGVKSNLNSVKSNGYKIEPNYEATREERLKSVGITTGKFVQPNIQIEVEACPLLDADNKEISEKTMIKLHIYDAAQDPFSTLGEILAATRDDQLNVIRIPASEFNQQASAPGGASTSQIAAMQGQIAAMAGSADSILEKLPGDGNYYKVKGTYDEIKSRVSAGMPYVIYGSQNSAITTANLQSNNNAGLGNVMLQRAFNAAGDYDPAAVDAGVPMQIVPSQLSLSTIGCPLFFPMQRIFVDFGTGTTADNVYFVTQIDHTVGSDGFKTEVKMSYGQGFATYTSLAQNLAAALSVIRGGTLEAPSIEFVDPSEETSESAATDAAATAVALDLRGAVRGAREALEGLRTVTARGKEAIAAAQARAQQQVDAAEAAVLRAAADKVAAVGDPKLAAQAAEAEIAAKRASEEAAAAKKTADDATAAAAKLDAAVKALETQDPTLAALFVSQEVGTI